MRLFWGSVVTGEVIVLVVFSLVAASSDYFVRMPPSVSHGRSVGSFVAERAVFLVGLFSLVNLTLFLCIKGINLWQDSRRAPGIVALGAAVGMFVVVCVLFTGFIVFGFAQY